MARVNPDCLYLNTLVLGYGLGKLKLDRSRTRVISHAHEMQIGLLLSSRPDLVKLQLALSDVVVCCAESVKTDLIKIHHANPDSCRVITEYIPYTSPEELLNLNCQDASQSVVDSLRDLHQQGFFLFGFAGSRLIARDSIFFLSLSRSARSSLAKFLSRRFGLAAGRDPSLIRKPTATCGC